MTERNRLPVLLGARRYRVDLSKYARRPLASIRQQVDQGQEPGEQSFDNQGIWKRTQSDFVLGAGQEFFDQEDESNRRQFRTSKGIDPWDRRSITLLKDTASVDTLGNGDTGILLPTSSFLFAASGTAVSKYDTSDTETVITGLSGTITDMTVWGSNVYICASGQTIKSVAVSGSAASAFGSAPGPYTPDLAQAVAGRLVCADGNVLYELDNAGQKLGGADIFTHPQSTFAFTKIVGAPNGIYVVGNDNNNSVVYLLTVVDATGELAAPYPVAETLYGEFIRDMVFYGGVMFVATSRGLRLANINGSGFLTFGPLISQPGDCRAIAAFGQHLWFGWTNYDGTSTGLGRMGPEYFTKTLAPAFASDLMYTAQGTVHDVAVFNNRPYFIYDDGSVARIVREHATNYVSVGTFWSGAITYGTPELKSVLSGEASWDALPSGSSIVMDVLDGIGGAATNAFTNSTAASTGMKASLASAFEKETSEVRLTLNRGATATARPRVRRWTIRSQPLPFRAEEIIVAIDLHERVDDDGMEIGMGSPYSEFQYLHGLMTGRSRVPFQFGIGGESLQVVVDSIEPVEGMSGWDRHRNWPEGLWAVRLVTVP